MLVTGMAGVTTTRCPRRCRQRFFAAVIFAIYAFASIVGFRTRTLTRPTDRTAQDMYDNYADSPHKQRRYAKRHGGEGHDEE